MIEEKKDNFSETDKEASAEKFSDPAHPCVNGMIVSLQEQRNESCSDEIPSIKNQ